MSKKEENLLPNKYVLQMFPQFATLTEKEKTRIRKTSYYRQRIDPAPITAEEVKRLSKAQIWELTHASPATIHRWKTRPDKIPYSVQQLLKCCAYGIIPQGFGEWGGFHFGKDGHLYPLDSAIGYAAREIYGFYLIETAAGRVPGLEARIKRLEAELSFHKAQTKENSQLGFMRGMIQVLQERD